jgi:hypothetical protein
MDRKSQALQLRIEQFKSAEQQRVLYADLSICQAACCCRVGCDSTELPRAW